MNKIAVVIVTYNRLTLLKQCITAVRNQTFKDFDIIVVNNGSSDGTKEWLDTQLDIYTITQNNLGGSGGFHNGIKAAYQRGYENFWIMDDDGIPASSCLKKLFEVSCKGFKYVAPNLITAEGIPHFKDIKYTSDNIISHCGGPFNAILLSRELIHAIGLPNKYYFIWGDEYEFVNRVKESFFHVALVKDAIHYHKIPGNNPKLVEKRIYYKVRNMIWSARLNKGIVKGRRNQFVSSSLVITKYFISFFLRFKFKVGYNLLLGIKDGIVTNKHYIISGNSLNV